ncbi:MAG: succinate dehydrogenase, hydrophobic membrane anchor protein [Parafilimonas terrae]|nr:succinate dehydrogenase, hydrophobic membrane anchor protein [Parafilimonas terrae]
MSDNPRHAHDELRRVRYLGSARSGTTQAWHMRLTSLALVPLTFGVVWLIVRLAGRPYADVYRVLSHPLPTLVLLLFIGAGLYHMQLGMRTIIEDYVHGAHAKESALVANLFFCIAIGAACVYAVLRLSFV